MKRTVKLALAATMALSATSAFATNGDHLIGDQIERSLGLLRRRTAEVIKIKNNKKLKIILTFHMKKVSK